MLQQQCIDAKREELLKSLDMTPARNRVNEAHSDLASYFSGDETLEFSSGAFAMMSHEPRFQLFNAEVNSEGRQRALSFIATLKYLTFDLGLKMQASGLKPWNEIGFVRVSAMDCPMLQSIGWHDAAETMLHYLWTDYREANAKIVATLFGNPNPQSWVNDDANPYLTRKPAWFTTLTTVDPTLWRSHGYDPDSDSLGAYWLLAQNWDDPDPTKVRDALQAVRDLNISTILIKDKPIGNRVYLVDEFLLLDDYDIRSINMRRIDLGLEPVEVESYLSDPLPNEVLPFAEDDVFWPAYLKMCEEVGAAPLSPEKVVQVSLNPETLQVEKR